MTASNTGTTVAGGTLRRLSAFSSTPEGGNPAGVWIGEVLPTRDHMLSIAAEVGYSETAFIVPSSGPTRTVRYYSPLAEVAFCGHATIASAVALGQVAGPGNYVFETTVGPIPVAVGQAGDGTMVAALTSVEPRWTEPSGALLAEALAALGWSTGDLDEDIAPALAFGGNWHLVIAVNSRATLAALDYDYPRLEALMAEHELTTLQLVWRESTKVWHSRNPFPPGGVVEDAATGAAAVALGGYLRGSGIVKAPIELTIHQGVDMGRPSVLTLSIRSSGGVSVSGTAVDIPA